MLNWWDKREENDVAWRVAVEDLKEGYDLDVKNPHQPEEEQEYSSTELIDMLHQSFAKSDELLAQLGKTLKS